MQKSTKYVQKAGDFVLKSTMDKSRFEYSILKITVCIETYSPLRCTDCLLNCVEYVWKYSLWGKMDKMLHENH